MQLEDHVILDFDISPVGTSRLGEVDFENLTFGKVFSDHMFVMDYADGAWQRGEISAFGPMTFSPAMMSLHYGQAIFEGMKAFRQQDGSVSLFRPGRNIQRLNFSARRLSMPEVPEDIVFQAIVELVKLDSKWVPSAPDSALYIRPFMFATESHVGVRPSLNYRLCIFTCPVGAYYTKPVRVKVETKFTVRLQVAQVRPKRRATTLVRFIPQNWPKRRGTTKSFGQTARPTPKWKSAAP